jgi:hypothetical protein
MNKTEKLICLFLGMALVWCFLSGRDTQPPKEAEKAVASAAESKASADGAANAPANTAAVAEAAVTNAVVAAEVKKAPEMYKPDVPEETNFLENAELKL